MTARPARDEGSALVLALVFLSLFGVSIASLLTFVDTGFRVGRSTRTTRAEVYAAGGATNVAIESIRGVLTAGREGEPCPDVAAPAVNGLSATVTCTPLPGSGAVTGGGAPDPATHPRWAVLALANRADEHGIVQGSNAELRIRGDILSHSTIHAEAASATMSVDGEVKAVGACTEKVVSTKPPVQCNLGTPPADGADPGWAPMATAPTNEPAIPACGSGTVLTFTPGRYGDATMLDALTGGRCPHKILWFQPGVYWFDFSGKADKRWDFEDPSVTVVGGTPKGWSPSSPSTIAVPGSCKRDTDPTPNAGVQWVLSGETRMKLKAGRVELCPQPSTTTQQIAVYAVKAAVAGYSALTGCSVTAPFGSGSACALLATEGSQTSLVVHGTVYAPSAAIDLQMTNHATVVFGRGVVARVFYSKITPSSGYTGPFVGLPLTGTLRADRDVMFTAWLGGRARLRARVSYADGGGWTPGGSVRINTWSVKR